MTPFDCQFAQKVPLIFCIGSTIMRLWDFHSQFIKEVYLSACCKVDGKRLDSDPSPLSHLIIAFFLLLLNGFFVLTEFALMYVRGYRLQALGAEGTMKAKAAARVLQNVSAYISTCRIGITATSIGLGWLGGMAVARTIEPVLKQWHPALDRLEFIGILFAFLIVAVVHYIVSQQVPKISAMQKAEKMVLWSAVPIVIFHQILFPVAWVLNKASNWILRKLGVRSHTGPIRSLTEEDIRSLVKESHKNGNIDQTELILVNNVFEFTETIGREIMIPRTELACLYTDLTFEENLEITAKEMRTRYPVCDPDKDNIIGFVHIKDLLKATKTGLKNLHAIVRPLLSVPETMPISEILKLMQKKRTEIALLIDEYGGTSGLVTMEDILEELVGEIYDEFDKERPSIEQKDRNTHSVDGLLHIDEFNDYFGLKIETEDYDTIGGWLYSQLETLPAKNSRVFYDGFEFIVDEVDHHRISRIVVKKRENHQEQSLSIVS